MAKKAQAAGISRNRNFSVRARVQFVGEAVNRVVATEDMEHTYQAMSENRFDTRSMCLA